MLHTHKFFDDVHEGLVAHHHLERASTGHVFERRSYVNTATHNPTEFYRTCFQSALHRIMKVCHRLPHTSLSVESHLLRPAFFSASGRSNSLNGISGPIEKVLGYSERVATCSQISWIMCALLPEQNNA